MTIEIKHQKTDNIADWTQAQLNQKISEGAFPAGTVLADIVLPSDWNDTHTVEISNNRLLGNTTGGVGSEEISVSAPLTLSGGALGLTTSGVDHGGLGGLSDDDHTQYALLAGRSGGQTITGGTAASNNLILRSTTNGTKGSILFDETTSSTSRSTGALIVGNGTSGGLGVGGRIHAGGLTTHSTILAGANQSYNIGSPTSRFLDFNAAQLRIMRDSTTGGTVTVTSTAGVDTGSYILNFSGSAGIMTATLDNGTNTSLTLASIFNDSPNSTADIINRSNGTIVIGGTNVYSGGVASAAHMSEINTDSGSGATSIGYCYVNTADVTANTAQIFPQGLGAFFAGAAGINDFGGGGGNTLSATTNGSGSTMLGLFDITDGTNCTLTAASSSAGGLVQGAYLIPAGSSGTSLTVEAIGTAGSRVLGYGTRGIMRASNLGSTVIGVSQSQSDASGLFATGIMSLVVARVTNTGSMTASGVSSAIFGNNTGSGSGLCSASGFVYAVISSSGGVTQASTAGLAWGRANSTGSISTSGGAVNWAVGDAGAIGISATGASGNCFQWGVGTASGANSISDSTHWGDSIRILHKQGTATASNGDIVLGSGGDVLVRSNGIDRDLSDPRFDSITVPSTGTNSEKFGSGAACGATRGLAMGYLATCTGGVGSIAIGDAASATGTSSGSVALGDGATASVDGAFALGVGCSALASNNTAFGASNSCNGTTASAVLGGGISSLTGSGASVNISSAGGNLSGANSVLMLGSFAETLSGNFCFQVGGAAFATYSSNNTFAINGAPTAADQIVFGGVSTAVYKDMFLGRGVTNATATDVTIQPTGGSGSNNAAGDLYINGAKSTGNAAAGDVFIQTTEVGASGSTAQTLYQRISVLATEIVVNDDSRDIDFRIETDATTNAFFVDAGANEIKTAAATKLGFFGANAVAQQAGTGEATGFTAGAGTNVTDQSTFTGNVGSTAYRINDIVKALKNLGLLAQ